MFLKVMQEDYETGDNVDLVDDFEGSEDEEYDEEYEEEYEEELSDQPFMQICRRRDPGVEYRDEFEVEYEEEERIVASGTGANLNMFALMANVGIDDFEYEEEVA